MIPFQLFDKQNYCKLGNTPMSSVYYNYYNLLRHTLLVILHCQVLYIKAHSGN